MSRIHSILCLAALAVSATALAGTPPAAQAVILRASIAPQEVTTALKTWARESGIQVMYVTQVAKGIRSPGAPAGLAPDEALKRILAGTGLSFKVVNERAVSVFVAQGSAHVEPADMMRVAALGEGDEKSRSPESSESSADRNSVTVRDTKVPGRPRPFSTANLDLTRTEDDVLPFTVFTAEEIRGSGAANLPEFLRNRLPQNLSEDNNAELQLNPGDASNSRVDMRGWGQAETVFLLNGRTMGAEYPNRGGDGSNASPNLRGIPLASIERIEILTSAGSAIYGANATGGVINIITRRDFRGGQLSVGYDTPADVLRPQRSIDFNYGVPLSRGFGLRLAASYSDSEPMQMGDRGAAMMDRYRTLARERDPSKLISWVANPADPGSQLYTQMSSFYGRTANIRGAATTTNLFAGLPGVPGSNYTTVPDGYTGAGGRAAFKPGTFNIELADGGGSTYYARQAQRGPQTGNYTLSLGLDRRLGERWQWSLDQRYSRNDFRVLPFTHISFSAIPANYAALARSSFGLGISTAYPQVPAGAPANPFGQNLLVSLVDPALDLPQLASLSSNTVQETSSTLRGEIGRWRGFIDLAYSRTNKRDRSGAFVEPAGGWNAAFLSGAYDPFIDPRVGAYADPQFYTSALVSRTLLASSSEQYRATVKASGPLFKLPAGDLQLTLGAEGSRVDRAPVSTTTTVFEAGTGHARVPSFGALDTARGALVNTLLSTPFVIDTYGGYAETNIPLLSSSQGLPFIERLELFGSGRVDRTARDFVRSTSDARPVDYGNTARIHAYGLAYEPVAGVALRASRSIGIKPPALAQIVPSDPPAPTSAPTTVIDPLRNNELRQITYSMYITGGNPDLKPESTESTNLGMILTPRWLPGLRLSLDYLESVRDDAIFGLGAQDTVNLEAELSGIVQRGPPDASGVGPIIFLDRRNINLRRISSRSLDFRLEQEIREVGAGRLLLSLRGTRNLSFKVQTTNTGPAVEQVGARGSNGALQFSSRQVEWSGNAQLRWEGPRLAIGWNARYLDQLLLPITPNYAALQDDDRAPRAIDHDLDFTYQIPSAGAAGGVQGWLAGTSLNFGVKNVFNRAPRFWAPDTLMGIAPYDNSVLRGRSLWMRVSRDFQ